LWQTRRYLLDCPIATIVRFSDTPNPEVLSETKITDSRLDISYSIIGRTVTLSQGALTQNYVVTGYTSTSITVSGATFVSDGFTLICTYTIAGRPEIQQNSPTRVQLASVDGQSILKQPVAWYNLNEKEIRQFAGELTVLDKRFVFYDVRVTNSDIIILHDTITTLGSADHDEKFEVHNVRYSITYDKSIVFAKAIT
jgi:hypothetical protein